MAFTLDPLPFDKSALEPHMSAKTLELHHDKHHATYVKKLNELIAGSKLEGQTLEQIILATARKSAKAKIFNNAAQTWNHAFFWKCLKAGGGGKPDGRLAERIEADLGGFEAMKKKFSQVAADQFGSGWAWLVLDKGKLAVIGTGNADLPLAHQKQALLTLDVWEHAYYVDYQNRRPDFITAFLDHLVNWDFAAANLETYLSGLTEHATLDRAA